MVSLSFRRRRHAISLSEARSVGEQRKVKRHVCRSFVRELLYVAEVFFIDSDVLFTYGRTRHFHETIDSVSSLFEIGHTLLAHGSNTSGIIA